VPTDNRPARVRRPELVFGERERWAVRLLFSIAAAGALTGLLWQFIPTRLDVSTSVLGWPTRYDFNIFRQWYIYGLLVFVFPLSTLAVFVVITHNQRRAFGVTKPHQSDNAARGAPRRSLAWQPRTRLGAPAGHIARVLGVASVLGLEGSVALQKRTSLGGAVFFVIAVAYVVAVLAMATAAHRWTHARITIWTGVSFFNCIGTLGCVVGLYGVSRATEVAIVSTHTVRKVPWLPAWLAMPVTLAALVAIACYLRSHRNAKDILRVERWVMLVVALPAAFFVLHAGLIGAMGPVNSFEEGQLLVGTYQVMHGAFPWRDIILAHGIFGDVFQLLPGFALIEVSRWGGWAGSYLLVEPVYWLLLYGLVVYLTRARWVYSVLFVAIIVLGNSFLGGFLSQENVRFLPVPLVIGAFALLLKRATWSRAVLFSGGLLALVVVTPESLIFVGAFLVILIAFELDQRPLGGRLGLSTFPRLWRSVVTGGVWGVVLIGWLAWNQGLDGFIFYFKTFVPAHILEGIPITHPSQPSTLRANEVPTHLSATFFRAGMYVPITLGILYLGAMAWALLKRSHPTTRDWVGGVLAIGVVLYYSKFLGRAEGGHLAQYLAFTTPFLVYVVYRVLDQAQSWLSGRDWRSKFSWTLGSYALTTALIVGILIPSGADLIEAAKRAPGHFRPTVQAPATISRVGYALPGVVDPQQLADVRKVITAVGGARPRVWDFSNSPADLYFFQQLQLLTRYDNVSIAIEASTQRDVINELRKARPDLIVYNSVGGLTAWDGLPNMVRHYDVSAWILRNYHPLLAVRGILLFERNSAGRPPQAPLTALKLSTPISVANLYTDFAGACDWGYVPNFFSQHPKSAGSSQGVALQATGKHVILSGYLAAGTNVGPRPVEVFATDHAGVQTLGRVATNLLLLPGTPGYYFEVDAPLTSGQPPADVSVSVRTAGGMILGVPDASVRLDPAVGNIEARRTVWEDQLTVPPGLDHFHWLELSSRSNSTVPPDHFALSLVNQQTQGILFSARSEAPRPFDVRLDNCSQWRAMPGEIAVLSHTRPQPGLSLQFRE
jgi:hypothetical protein